MRISAFQGVRKPRQVMVKLFFDVIKNLGAGDFNF
jgi:hypothetical protein